MTREYAERQMEILLDDITVAEDRLRASTSPIDREVERTHVTNRKAFYRALQAALEPVGVTA